MSEEHAVAETESKTETETEAEVSSTTVGTEGEPEFKRPRVEPSPEAAADADAPAVAETEAPAAAAETGSLDADDASTVTDKVPTSGSDAVTEQPASDPDAGRTTGTVKQWRDDKGFGFIAADDGSDDLFVHRTSLEDGDCLIEGKQITYIKGIDDRKGKLQALHVKGSSTRSAQPNGALTIPGAPGAVLPASAAGALYGTAKSWNAEKRFGFIKPDDGSEDVFAHRTSIQGSDSLQVGARVRYTKVPDGARAKAQDVVIVSQPHLGVSPYAAPPPYAPYPQYAAYPPAPYPGAPAYPHAPPAGYPGAVPGYPAAPPPAAPANVPPPGYPSYGAYDQAAQPSPYGAQPSPYGAQPSPYGAQPPSYAYPGYPQAR